MNLSLRTFGKSKCEEIKSDLLELLINMMDHSNDSVRT